VVWRDGVHLTGTPLWCDARRRQDICFVSSVERIPRTGHGQLIATPATLALLGSTDGHLGVPVRQRFTLGTVRLELIPSGRGIGAAALLADIAGKKVLYANTVRTVSGGAGDPAEVRSCDALVVGAPFGEVHHVFPSLVKVIDETTTWATAQLAAQRRPVLFVDGVLDGLEIAKTLHDRGVAVSAHRAVREAATRGSITGIATVGKEPRAVIWLDGDHAGLAKAMRATSFATALVSGRAIEGGAGYDAAFAWATAADRAQLLGWIEAANARQVFVTGPCADAIAAAVGGHARVIGPPQQMALFAR
jgi:putative mRNA 3-end processing factor